jgi:NADH-quinone oxidoreductase subunit J
MAEAVAFYTLAALILLFAVAVITVPNTVHSVMCLVADFLLIAVLFVMLQAEFLAVIQILVYAGGIVVLYLFVVMLVNQKRLPETHQDPNRRDRLGLVMSGVVLAEFVAIALYTFATPKPPPAAVTGAAAGMPATVTTNVEQIGWTLYAEYLVPFEVASILLLVAMLGAIVLAKKQV